LYWCTTDDGDEDWFVVATSTTSARSFHERAEGYASGDATAELIVTLPDSLLREGEWHDPQFERWSGDPGWPSDAVLRSCGADIAPLARDEFRDSMGVVCKVVRFGDRAFRAGDAVTNAFERKGVREPARLAAFKGGKAPPPKPE
jgi:hypothetical protein